MKLGDSHNGKCVSLVQRGITKVVNKPRCVFWEYLFLDQTSEFRKFSRSNTDIQFDEILGNVGYFSSDQYFSGDASFISQSVKSNNDLSKIGELSAVALAFGFGDLHNSNLVNDTRNNLQIIDLECVFSRYDLLQSTLIAPAKWNVDNSKTLLEKFCINQRSKLTWQQLYQLLSSFIVVTRQLINHREAMVSHFQSQNKTYAQYPIRILLRPTAQYQQAIKNDNFSNDFMLEEIEQMERGDIPYFWGFLGGRNIFWNDYNDARELISTNAKVESLRERSFCLPEYILEKTRLEQLILNVTAELVKNILDHESENNLTDLINLEKVGNRVLVKLLKLGIQVSYSIG